MLILAFPPTTSIWSSLGTRPTGDTTILRHTSAAGMFHRFSESPMPFSLFPIPRQESEVGLDSSASPATSKRLESRLQSFMLELGGFDFGPWLLPHALRITHYVSRFTII